MNPLRDRSAPGVRIVVLPHERADSGERLDLGDRIISFTFEDDERRADRVSLQLDNFDLSLFEDDGAGHALIGGALLEVSWGYPGHMAIPRRAVLKKLKGFTTLTVEAHALSALMNREARTRSWENVTRADVARRIATERGYEGAFVDVDDTAEVFDVLNQTGETDARFLRRLAAREGYVFYIDAGGFHFHQRRQHAAPTHVFTWYADPGRGDVLSIQVESDLSRRAGRVTVRGRDPLRRRTIEHTATSDNVDRATLSEVVEVVDPETGATSLETRNATASMRATAASSPVRVKRQADARFRSAERAAIKLSMTVVGDPTLHAKSLVELRGVSAYLAGKYYVRRVKHVISGSGYTCDLEMVRDGTGRRARRLAREQRGTRNRSRPQRSSALREVEVVDRETGDTAIEYWRTDESAASELGDSEARTNRPED